MAKRQKKQTPAKPTRKHLSRVAQERRQILYIRIGFGIVAAVVILLVVAGLFKTRLADPAATRSAKEELKTIPAVAVDDTMISIADWQARVKFQRQLLINQVLQISQQMSYFDVSTEFGQQIISQGQAQIDEIRDALDLGDGIASDVLDRMVEDQLIRQEAALRGISISDQELQKYIEVDIFSYPFPPTPQPYPTVPPPVLPPTSTVTPVPTLTPTTPPTPRSRQDFDADYLEYMQQIQKVTEMSEDAWRTTLEADLIREKLMDDFGSEVETNVPQIKSRYIVAGDQETADALLVRLEEGEAFEQLEEEVDADDSEEPGARTGSLDWSPIQTVQQRFGEAFAATVFNAGAGDHIPVVIPAFDGQFYLVFMEGNETRELADYLVDQRRLELFESWLDDAKLGPGIEYGNWSPYIPREPNI